MFDELLHQGELKLTKISNAKGSTCTDSNGNTLRTIGNHALYDGGYEWTDGTAVYGNMRINNGINVPYTQNVYLLYDDETQSIVKVNIDSKTTTKVCNCPRLERFAVNEKGCWGGYKDTLYDFVHGKTYTGEYVRDNHEDPYMNFDSINFMSSICVDKEGNLLEVVSYIKNPNWSDGVDGGVICAVFKNGVLQRYYNARDLGYQKSVYDWVKVYPFRAFDDGSITFRVIRDNAGDYKRFQQPTKKAGEMNLTCKVHDKFSDDVDIWKYDRFENGISYYTGTRGEEKFKVERWLQEKMFYKITRTIFQDECFEDFVELGGASQQYLNIVSTYDTYNAKDYKLEDGKEITLSKDTKHWGDLSTWTGLYNIHIFDDASKNQYWYQTRNLSGYLDTPHGDLLAIDTRMWTITTRIGEDLSGNPIYHQYRPPEEWRTEKRRSIGMGEDFTVKGGYLIDMKEVKKGTYIFLYDFGAYIGDAEGANIHPDGKSLVSDIVDSNGYRYRGPNFYCRKTNQVQKIKANAVKFLKGES